jgi:hypothetical protein
MLSNNNFESLNYDGCYGIIDKMSYGLEIRSKLFLPTQYPEK